MQHIGLSYNENIAIPVAGAKPAKSNRKEAIIPPSFNNQIKNVSFTIQKLAIKNQK